MNRQHTSITFLGTGTSTGVPVIGCDCEVCRSTDVRDQRLRTSALITRGDNRLLIDCGPDFRQQMLTNDIKWPDAILITHSHADHIGGIEDLRPGRVDGSAFDIYCTADVEADIRARLPYCFATPPYPGTPRLNLHEIKHGKVFRAAGMEILPFRVMHGHLPITGYRIGDTVYITDCSELPDESLELIHGCALLVINALRIRRHHSHMNLQEALDVINYVKPRRAVLTHMCHSIGRHEALSLMLPPGVEPGYDGLTIDEEPKFI
ncbi:MAG: MBL fold metallo-hydrolase [Muribaculaceae bacterium]|nr:MBL fold metallo-hydrolase [Muribaculaceae bacterium]